MTANKSLYSVVVDYDLAAADYKVLFLMTSQMGYDNVCELTVTEIADILGLSRRICSRAVKRLREIQVIHPVRTVGRATFYMVSPYLSFKAKEKEQRRMIEKWDAIFQDVPPVLDVIEGKKGKTQPPKQNRKSKSKTSKSTA